MLRTLIGAGVALLGFASCLPASTQEVLGEHEERVTGYSKSQDLADPVTLLQKRLDKKKSLLTYDRTHGYLSSLLQAFEISAETQALVFSKTSSQKDQTSPQTPRALYFNDT